MCKGKRFIDRDDVMITIAFGLEMPRRINIQLTCLKVVTSQNKTSERHCRKEAVYRQNNRLWIL